MSLFASGSFVLASGGTSSFKIECDSLTGEDWRSLAAMAVERLPGFKRVEGVPRGGLPFAAALGDYVDPDGELDVLIADDVWTTGGSVEEYIEKCVDITEDFGIVVAFDRSGGLMYDGERAFLALWTLAN